MKRLVDILKETARFRYFRDGVLYYETDSGFKVAVPTAETGNATYLDTEKAIAFMKWLRPQYYDVMKEQPS